MTAAERQRRYRERNAEKVRDSQQRWLAANPDRRKEVARNHYLRNADAEKARNMEWRRKNPEAWRRISNASEERRRAQKAKAGIFDISPKDLRRIYSQPCAACGATEGQTMDHIIPLARGGRHSIGNLQTLCGACNYSKNRKLLIEWRAYKMLVAA